MKCPAKRSWPCSKWTKPMQNTALYIHIPFCKRKCAYCDFASFPERESTWAPYLLGLESEMKEAAQKYGRLPVSTVFIGGGTPSLLPSDAVMHLLAMTRARFSLDPDAEITVEANPCTVSEQKLRDYRDAGVNRLSLGMQAAQDSLLKMLGRIHHQTDVEQAVTWARKVGFTAINLDLMYALPGQTMADWVDTLKQATALNPTHLSCYSLIVEADTPLAQRIQSGELAEPDEALALNMQHGAARILLRRGFKRYEISNYALPGRECRHNIVYWTRGDYLGLGLSAHSLMDNERFANTDDLDAYLKGVREVSREIVDEKSAREEAIMLGTRMARGIDTGLLTGCTKAIDQLTALGLVEVNENRLALTDAGFDVHNAVVMKLVQGDEVQ